MEIEDPAEGWEQQGCYLPSVEQQQQRQQQEQLHDLSIDGQPLLVRQKQQQQQLRNEQEQVLQSTSGALDYAPSRPQSPTAGDGSPSGTASTILVAAADVATTGAGAGPSGSPWSEAARDAQGMASVQLLFEDIMDYEGELISCL